MNRSETLLPGDLVLHKPSMSVDVVMISHVDTRGTYLTNPDSAFGFRLGNGSVKVCDDDLVGWRHDG